MVFSNSGTRWQVNKLSEASACITINTPENLDFTANFVAPIKLSAASEDGLSDDL